MPVEEQTEYNTEAPIYSSNAPNVGQRLTIPNRKVTKLGFWLRKYGSPELDVTLRILRVSDNTVINSKVWGDAGDLPTEFTYEEVEFDTPEIINEEVRMVVTHTYSSSTNNVRVAFQNTDVKENEYLTRAGDGTWSDETTQDCAYRYTYEFPQQPGAPRQQMATFLIGGKR